jgi:glycosyltransferase involved in cell wall biosynthesis
MLASFIIPAYNASTTIVRCLESIYTLGLSEQEFEVICIDDCSKDNTIEAIEQYAKQHTNLTLLCQAENHRQGAARNRGVAIAKGKYIVYVDSDDESDKGIIEALQLAEDHQLDMVAMHYVNVNEHGNILEKEPITIDGVFTGVELQTKHPYWCAGPVPYVYKTNFLQQVNYPFTEDVLYEDSDYVTVHLYHAKRMMYSAKCAYRVHYNATSTTHTTTYKHSADYVLLGTRMLKFYHSLEDKTSTYALGIREGGSHNIWRSFKRLMKLSTVADVRAFYERIDTYINRADYLHYTEPAYCWTWWTKLCLKHKKIAVILVAIGQWGYKAMKRRTN